MNINLMDEAQELKDLLVALRRDFHENPELGFEEWRTSGKIKEFLTNEGIEYIETAKTGVCGGYKDGVYTGTGKGNGGDVTVEVTVEGGNIVKIELKDHKETPGIFEGAEAGVSNEIIKTQSTDVESVSGATLTSEAIKTAVAEAIKDAK